MNSKRIEFQLDTLCRIEDDQSFAAMAAEYKDATPVGISIVAFTFHATSPLINRKNMSITLPTMMASYESAIDKMVDFEHQAEDLPLGVERTEVVGHIKALSMGDPPDAADPEAWVIPGIIPATSVITRGIMVLYDRIASVQAIVDDVREGRAWYFSLEIGEQLTPPEIWLVADGNSDHEIIPWDKASDELKKVASQAKDVTYKGRKLAYLMGGSNGRLSFIGGAVTTNPAGREQFGPGSSLLFVASASPPDTRRTVFSVNWAKGSEKNMPDSAFAVVEPGGATHLPYRGPDGRVNMHMLASALGEMGSIQPVDSSQNAEELQDKAREILFPYARFIRDNKGNGAGDIPPEMQHLAYCISLSRDIDSILELANTDSEGGDRQVAEVEMTQEEFNAKMATMRLEGRNEGETAGRDSALTAAVEAGTHITADDLEKKIVAESDIRVRKAKRENAIASLPMSDEMKADLRSISTNTEQFPFDDDGDGKFDSRIEDWKANLATAAGEGKEGEGKEGEGKEGEGGEGRKTASLDGKKFDSGSGGGDGKKDDKPSEMPLYTNY